MAIQGSLKRLSVHTRNAGVLEDGLAKLLPQYNDDARQTISRELSEYRKAMALRSSLTPLHRQTGRLERSWAFELTGTKLADMNASVFTYSGYSIIHELGLKVVPGGNAKWVYIPTEFNRLGGTGKAINTPKQVLDDGGHYGKAWLNGRNKNVLMDRHDEPMFILAKSAQYRAVLGFFDRGYVEADIALVKLSNQFVDTFEKVVP